MEIWARGLRRAAPPVITELMSVPNVVHGLSDNAVGKSQDLKLIWPVETRRWFVVKTDGRAIAFLNLDMVTTFE